MMEIRNRTAAAIVLLALVSGCRSTDSQAEAGATGDWAVTYEQLSGVPDDEVEWYIVERVNEYVGDQYDMERVFDLPLGIRAAYSTWELEGEVNNGGFSQYFLNTDGLLVDEAIGGYRLFGARRTASLVERAVLSRDDEAALSRLDDEFYDLTEPYVDLRVRYIRDNPDAF